MDIRTNGKLTPILLGRLPKFGSQSKNDTVKLFQNLILGKYI